MEEKEEYGRIQGVRKRAPFYYYMGSFNNYGDKKRWVGVVLWGQPIKLIQVVSTSEFHEY